MDVGAVFSRLHSKLSCAHYHVYAFSCTVEATLRIEQGVIYHSQSSVHELSKELSYYM